MTRRSGPLSARRATSPRKSPSRRRSEVGGLTHVAADRTRAPPGGNRAKLSHAGRGG
jgi:hypothetical protein